jgi:phage terminase large subunit-like protein
MAWDGAKAVKALVTHALRKPAEICYRLYMSNGEVIEAAANHRVFCDHGEYDFVSQILTYVPCLVRSIQECGQLVRVSNGQHSIQIPVSYRDGCSGGCHPCGERLLIARDSVQVSSPSQADALLHNSAASYLDDQGYKYSNNPQQEYAHPSNQDADCRNGGQSAESECQASCNCAQLRKESNQEFLPLSIAELSLLELGNEVVQCPLFSPSGNRIIAYEMIPSKPIYDFTVPVYHNYITSEIVHHNTYAGGSEAAYHATGKYPDWWQGKRFASKTVGWAGSVTGEVTRDTIQRMLLGPVGSHGTGYIPQDDIVEVKMARGMADLVDTILVRHVTGGISRIRLKYYEQGREKWQADTVDWVWFDEEPPPDIYSEGLTRTNATGGIVWTTFTPLLGMSTVVTRFLTEKSDDRADINMTIEDAHHISAEQRKKIIDSYPAHEREARINGTPMLGSGRIFPYPEEKLKVAPFTIPEFWPQIGGMDFGYDHPFAACSIAHDPEADIIYVTREYREREQTPIIHAASLRPWGDWLPWAWPHDGLQHDKGSADKLKTLYEAQGLKLTFDRATWVDGSNGVEAGLFEMLDRMKTGRWKVFSTCGEWFEEYRLYHRKDGKIVKLRDDLLSASRYALMMLRMAETKPRFNKEKFTPFTGQTSWMAG